MSSSEVAQVATIAWPLALALILFGIVLLAAGVVALRVVLRDTSEAARPDIIRALGEFFRALIRWRK